MAKSDLQNIETNLLTESWVDVHCDSSVGEIVKNVATGDLKTALTNPYTRAFLRIKATSPGSPLSARFDFASANLESGMELEVVRLAVAIGCLQAFVQVNWTGPDLDFGPTDTIDLEASDIDENTLSSLAITELASNGEPVYHLAKYHIFLRIAQIILDLPFQYCQTARWWKLRAVYVHQQVLDEPVALSPSTLLALEPLKSTYATSEPDLYGCLLLEEGLLEHQQAHDKSAVDFFVQAARATGLRYELTGALGKRTKFQETELSQLVVLAESRDRSAKQESTIKHAVPDTLSLNDDTVLEQTAFTENKNDSKYLGHIMPSLQPALHPLDQCILLALCVNVKNTSPAHGLTTEQMKPYVARVISHPLNWSIHTMALLLRSRLEAHRTRTVERSTLQLQALIDQMPTSDSTFVERIRYFYALPLPSKWNLERELANQFLALGVVRSALEIFERLEMWEEVVKCYSAMEQPEKAIKIVRELLDGRKEEADSVISRAKTAKSNDPAGRQTKLDRIREAKLWCVLGELEPKSALAHYTRAWEISNHTSGRAMRSLGGYHFAKGEFKETITCLRRAVAISPLLSRSWFLLGCAYIKVEDWEGGRNSFSRCIALDEEDAESWSNLASMYLRMPSKLPNVDEAEEIAPSVPYSNKMLAFHALKQGLKYSYENWRMWSNYMVVSVDVGELSEACRALGRIVEIRGAKVGADSVDEDILDRLVDAVARNDVNGAPSSDASHGLVVPVNDLFSRVLLPRVSSPRVFRAYGRLMRTQERWPEALKAYLDAYRVGPASTILLGSFDVGAWRAAITEVEELVDILRNFGPRVPNSKWKFQAKSIVRTFMGRTKDHENQPEWARLVAIQEELRLQEDC